MLIKHLDHVNIRTAQLQASIDFYSHAIGLTIKPPPMANDLTQGAYCHDDSDRAVIHLVATDRVADSHEPVRGAAQRGMVDHIALSCSGQPEELKARLVQHQLSFDAFDVPAIGMHLVFIRDPNGILVEMSFPL